MNQLFRSRKIPQHLISLWIDMGIRDSEKGDCATCTRNERNRYCSGYTPVTLHTYSVVDVGEKVSVEEKYGEPALVSC